MRVVEETTLSGGSVEFHFDIGPSVMVEEIRPLHRAPYWLAPIDITVDQKSAITTYSRLEVLHERT